MNDISINFIPYNGYNYDGKLNLSATNSSIDKTSIVKFGQIKTIDVFVIYRYRR